MTLRDKIVFITGASSGIGTACAIEFAKQGAKLLLCARRINLLQELAKQLYDEFQIDVYPFELDVRNPTQVQEALSLLPDAWKNIDILINNAGLAAGFDLIPDANIQDWEDMIDTNVKGVLYITKAVLPQMINRNTGHIINIGSVAGHEVYPKGAVYAATKHAVNAITKGLRMDLLGKKIRVSTVDPGAVHTNFSTVRFKGDDKRAAAVYEGIEALTAHDIADAVIYCATRPSHVNISEIIIMPIAQASATMIDRQAKGG